MVDEREISDIIERVRRRVGEPGPQLGKRLAVQEALAGPGASATGDGVYPTLDEAIAAAATAWRSTRMELDQRKTVIAAIRKAGLAQAEMLARTAVEETGLGRVDDKLTKNRLVLEKA